MHSAAAAHSTEPVERHDEAVEELLEALRVLPAEHHEEVHRQLAHAAINYQRTGSHEPLVMLVDSLLMTARLHRNPDYVKALADCEEDDWTDGGLDAESMVRQARERRSGPA